jgi:hypothetical protein
MYFARQTPGRWVARMKRAMTAENSEPVRAPSAFALRASADKQRVSPGALPLPGAPGQ